MPPKSLRHQLLLNKQFLEECVTDAVWKVAREEVHEAHSRPSVVAHAGLRGEQSLDDGIHHRAQVLRSIPGMFLEQLSCLGQVVLPVFLQQSGTEVEEKVVLLPPPVELVTRLTCKTQLGLLLY